MNDGKGPAFPTHPNPGIGFFVVRQSSDLVNFAFNISSRFSQFRSMKEISQHLEQCLVCSSYSK